MRKSSIFYLSLSAVMALMTAAFIFSEGIVRGGIHRPAGEIGKNNPLPYTPPAFYRGIYLSNDSACAPARFRNFLDAAEKSHINAFVMDVQTSKYEERMVPAGHVANCLSRGIHPIARVVVFPGGLSRYPPGEKAVMEIIDIAEKAARAGFKEIQFDYIRFSDENRHAGRLRHVTLKERHAFIEKFLSQAKARLSPSGVIIATDIFGRVPHNTNDRIGQKMEVFDRHVDVICPMAYPSHYWTKKTPTRPLRHGAVDLDRGRQKNTKGRDRYLDSGLQDAAPSRHVHRELH
jgi:hypothetical protein